MAIKTEEERAGIPCLIARCKTYKKIIACAVNDEEYRKEAAKSAQKWVREGLEISTIPVSEVRVADWCKCRKKQGHIEVK